MNIVPISELEVRLIARELLVKAVTSLQVDHAWLMENNELRECLQEKNSELSLLIGKYVDTLWSCHFLLKTKKTNLTQVDRDRYVELVTKKNHLRSQLIDYLSITDPLKG